MVEKTKYRISTSLHEEILRLAITGELTQDCLPGLVNEVFSILKSNTFTSALIDVRGAKGRFGFTEAYFRVRSYPPDIPRVKTAIVDSKENATFEKFHETTAANAGLSYKWFTDIEAAIAWLKGK